MLENGEENFPLHFDGKKLSISATEKVYEKTTKQNHLHM